MKRIVAIAIACATMVVSTGFVSPGDWFAFKGAGFDIAFPVEPVAQTKTIPSKLGELQLLINMYDASKSGTDDDNFIYMTMSTEYPGTEISSDNKEKLPSVFRNAIDGAVKNVEGTLLTEAEIELSGFPGREIKVDFKNGLAIIKARYFLVKNRMYMVQTITQTAKFPNASLDKFFGSFKLHAGG